MDWKLQCLVWITLASTSAYNYQGIGNPSYEYPQPHKANKTVQSRRSDSSYSRHSVTPTTGPGHEHRDHKDNPQRTSERSLPAASGIQRVQEKEKRRTPARTDEHHRLENGSYKIVNNYSIFPSVSSRRGEIQDAVVFPGPSSAVYTPEIPDECKDVGICKTIPNYPKELVDNILTELGKSRDLLYHMEQLNEPQISQRIGPTDTDEDIQLCNVREEIILPEAAKSKNGHWYIILNQKNKPLQGYRVEICRNEGQTCANNIASFYSSYTAICTQKYVQRTMAALDVNKKSIVTDLPFGVPSCCSCVAKQRG